jgi:hypothetical protein
VRAKLHAWFWLLAHPLHLLRRRARVQAKRRRPDSEILGLLSRTYRGVDEDHRWLNPVFRLLTVFLPLGD